MWQFSPFRVTDTFWPSFHSWLHSREAWTGVFVQHPWISDHLKCTFSFCVFLECQAVLREDPNHPCSVGPRLSGQVEDRSHPTPSCPPIPTVTKMATGGAPRFSLPRLLPVTTLLLSLLLTSSHALCKSKDARCVASHDSRDVQVDKDSVNKLLFPCCPSKFPFWGRVN